MFQLSCILLDVSCEQSCVDSKSLRMEGVAILSQHFPTASDPLVEPASTNLSAFSGAGDKLIFFHDDSGTWFSLLDALGYYKPLATDTGGAEKVAEWSHMFLVPGIAHCGGGPPLDLSDMLTPVVNWVEKGTAPDSVTATGKPFRIVAARSMPTLGTRSTTAAGIASTQRTSVVSEQSLLRCPIGKRGVVLLIARYIYLATELLAVTDRSRFAPAGGPSRRPLYAMGPACRSSPSG